MSAFKKENFDSISQAINQSIYQSIDQSLTQVSPLLFNGTKTAAEILFHFAQNIPVDFLLDL